MHTARFLIIGTATALAIGLGAAPAAAVSDTTAVTFTIGAGALSITVPASVGIGGGVPGSPSSTLLGTVTVNDTRTGTTTWTATVTSSAFTTGGGVAGNGEVIANTLVKYWSGVSTAVTGTGTNTEGQTNAAAFVVLSSSQTAFARSAGSGLNSVAWNPTLTITPGLANVAGPYTGTVTHSVS